MKTDPNALSKKPIIAAFDFDGTITTRDSLLPLLIYAAGRCKALKNFIMLLPTFIGYCLNIISRQHTKEKILSTFFDGKSIIWMRELGDEYARSPNLENLIRPEARKKLAWHQQQGHRCILISASIETYLAPWAKRMGFNDIIASRLKTTSGGIVTGQLEGLNCWGPEKTRRLEEILGPRDKYVLYAYGDSRGDKELLEMADYPFFKTFS